MIMVYVTVTVGMEEIRPDIGTPSIAWAYAHIGRRLDLQKCSGQEDRETPCTDLYADSCKGEDAISSCCGCGGHGKDSTLVF